jgi:hypothetical protein
MGSSTTDGPYRVVQWATGNIGTKALREVIAHPRLELVGVHVSSPAKVGLDAGELAGLDRRVGVAATGAIADVLALAPDCVLYMRQGTDVDEVCALLEAGIDIVTTRGEFHHPGSMDPALRERVEDACRRGGSSIHSTGSSPGFISEAVPIVLTSIQRRLDHLQIDEFADLSERSSPDLLFNIMGFGKSPDTFDQRRFAHGADAFGPSLRLVAEAIGLPLDEVVSSGAVATATHDTEIAAGPIAAGTVAAQRMAVTGMRGGEPLLSFRANWYCTSDIDADWDLGATGWRVVVEGDCPLDVELRFAIPLERMAATTPGYTANRAVNAVPYVCEAPPGIRTTVDLPQIIATLG